jgi:ribonuclease P protein component
LTTRASARSNTALFRIAPNGDQADLSAFEDTASAAAWLSRAQPHARRTRSAAHAPGPRTPPYRTVAASAKRFGFDASRRLKDKARFDRLLRSGERRSVHGYTFFFERRSDGAPRLGLLVTRKHALRASERNRIKRCIREAFRLEQERLGALDLLVRPPYGAKPGRAMIRCMRRLLLNAFTS